MGRVAFSGMHDDVGRSYSHPRATSRESVAKGTANDLNSCRAASRESEPGWEGVFVPRR